MSTQAKKFVPKTQLVKAKELRASALEVAPPKYNAKTKKTNMYVTYNKTGKVPKYVFPMLQSRFGLSYFVPQGKTEGSYSIGLNAVPRAPLRPNGMSDLEYEMLCEEAKKDVLTFFGNWEQVDDNLISYAITYCDKLWEDIPEEGRAAVVKTKYSAIVRKPKKGTDYPRSITLKVKPVQGSSGDPKKQQPDVRVFYEDVKADGTVSYTKVTFKDYECLVKDEDKTKFSKMEDGNVPTFEILEQLIGPNSNVGAVVDGYVWSISGRFGYNLSVDQFVIERQEVQNNNDCAFGDAPKQPKVQESAPTTPAVVANDEQKVDSQPERAQGQLEEKKDSDSDSDSE